MFIEQNGNKFHESPGNERCAGETHDEDFESEKKTKTEKLIDTSKTKSYLGVNYIVYSGNALRRPICAFSLDNNESSEFSTPTSTYFELMLVSHNISRSDAHKEGMRNERKNPNGRRGSEEEALNVCATREHHWISVRLVVAVKMHKFEGE